IFNPAAAGIAFATISFSEKMFLYPVPLDTHLPVFSNEIVGLVQSPSAILRFGGIPTTEISDMLFGNFAGPMGATNILVMLSCFAFLLIRRTTRPHTTVAYIVTCAILGGIFSRADMGFILSSIYELFSGTLLFGGIYMLGDSATIPTRNIGKIAFGIIAGTLTILFRHIGAFEQELMFVILICNSFVGVMDHTAEVYYSKKRSVVTNELN
ncbi:MAG: RnfABCDGE type electron transport complex subunit D, partial [Oscillospiraceae bacterium]